MLREEGETVHTSVTQETEKTFVLIILLQFFFLFFPDGDETTGQALLVML